MFTTLHLTAKGGGTWGTYRNPLQEMPARACKRALPYLRTSVPSTQLKHRRRPLGSSIWCSAAREMLGRIGRTCLVWAGWALQVDYLML